jgi:hypothetical protein
MTQTIVPIKSSTQVFTEIETIDRDIVMFADGSCALIVSTTAVNFGLLSEKEQDALIVTYAGLLNSLSFPIELLIRTQHKDVTAYLKLLEEKERTQKNPKLAKSMHDYRLFVAATVKDWTKSFLSSSHFPALNWASPQTYFWEAKKGACRTLKNTYSNGP